ncbi:PREDICTED: protein-methionine sulfoxide oxidase Mical-like [Priapulus caudatus]|uniref:F-actin monooxygenase n=1 Tax=Priapulus caudatus TaxID=37621 RepID=A0ABM1E0L8_PRICU|nr:PREDICTED: protein-methionine sulfoxide oxidase Mical-like [Priapulus caudatus]
MSLRVPRRSGSGQYAVDVRMQGLGADLFDKFVQAPTFKTILSTFKQMCNVLHLDPKDDPSFYLHLRMRVRSWKAESIWSKLDKRAAHKDYKKGKACNNTRALIIGGGPCGLRAAIELALLGAKVVVVEKRDRFSRNNVLHLWPMVIHDLKMLAAKKFFGKFCAGSIDHISIRQTQVILLKVALLLGIEFHANTAFEQVIEPPEDQSKKVGWRAQLSPKDHPINDYQFDVIIGADGKRNTLRGFKRKEFRGKLAIAVTANFINRHSYDENIVEEISGVAFIFNQKFFIDMRLATDIDLENIVYYKDDTHYFVMTAKKQSLLRRGVIRKDYSDTEMLLSRDNVDQAALMDYARDASSFAVNYALPRLDFALNQYGEPDVAMFDFTSMYQAEHAARVVERHGHKLLMALVGDSLLEPFWPTGSGCARGFLGVFDACWMVQRWCSGKLTPLQVLAEREASYRLLAQTKPANLHKNFDRYALDPASRYPNFNVNAVVARQVRSLYDAGETGYTDQIVELTESAPKRLKTETTTTMQIDRLLGWCQEQVEGYDGVTVENMSSSWRSGIALSAIIHRYRPNIIDLASLSENEVEKNNQAAFDIAEREFGIRPIMTGSEMADGDAPDPLKVTAYLWQLYEFFCNELPWSEGQVDERPAGRRHSSRGSISSRLNVLSKLNARRQHAREKTQDTLKTPLQGMDDSKRQRSLEVALQRFQAHQELEAARQEKQGRIRRELKELANNSKVPVRERRIPGLTEPLPCIMKEPAKPKPDEDLAARREQLRRRLESDKEDRLTQSQREFVLAQKGQAFTNAQLSSTIEIRDGDIQFRRDETVERADQTMREIDRRLNDPGSCDTGQRGSGLVGAMAQSLMQNLRSTHNIPRAQKHVPTVSHKRDCYFCEQRLYVMEQCGAQGLFFHRECLTCYSCGRRLHLGNYAYDGTPNEPGRFYCKSHYGLPPDPQLSIDILDSSREVDFRTSTPTSLAVPTGTVLGRGLTPERVEFESMREQLLKGTEEDLEASFLQYNTGSTNPTSLCSGTSGDDLSSEDSDDTEGEYYSDSVLSNRKITENQVKKVVKTFTKQLYQQDEDSTEDSDDTSSCEDEVFRSELECLAPLDLAPRPARLRKTIDRSWLVQSRIATARRRQEQQRAEREAIIIGEAPEPRGEDDVAAATIIIEEPEVARVMRRQKDQRLLLEQHKRLSLGVDESESRRELSRELSEMNQRIMASRSSWLLQPDVAPPAATAEESRRDDRPSDRKSRDSFDRGVKGIPLGNAPPAVEENHLNRMYVDTLARRTVSLPQEEGSDSHLEEESEEEEAEEREIIIIEDGNKVVGLDDHSTGVILLASPKENETDDMEEPSKEKEEEEETMEPTPKVLVRSPRSHDSEDSFTISIASSVESLTLEKPVTSMVSHDADDTVGEVDKGQIASLETEPGESPKKSGSNLEEEADSSGDLFARESDTSFDLGVKGRPLKVSSDKSRCHDSGNDDGVTAGMQEMVDAPRVPQVSLDTEETMFETPSAKLREVCSSLSTDDSMYATPAGGLVSASRVTNQPEQSPDAVVAEQEIRKQINLTDGIVGTAVGDVAVPVTNIDFTPSTSAKNSEPPTSIDAEISTASKDAKLTTSDDSKLTALTGRDTETRTTLGPLELDERMPSEELVESTSSALPLVGRDNDPKAGVNEAGKEAAVTDGDGSSDSKRRKVKFPAEVSLRDSLSGSDSSLASSSRSLTRPPVEGATAHRRVDVGASSDGTSSEGDLSRDGAAGHQVGIARMESSPMEIARKKVSIHRMLRSRRSCEELDPYPELTGSPLQRPRPTPAPSAEAAPKKQSVTEAIGLIPFVDEGNEDSFVRRAEAPARKKKLGVPTIRVLRRDGDNKSVQSGKPGTVQGDEVTQDEKEGAASGRKAETSQGSGDGVLENIAATNAVTDTSSVSTASTGEQAEEDYKLLLSTQKEEMRQQARNRARLKSDDELGLGSYTPRLRYARTGRNASTEDADSTEPNNNSSKCDVKPGILIFGDTDKGVASEQVEGGDQPKGEVSVCDGDSRVGGTSSQAPVIASFSKESVALQSYDGEEQKEPVAAEAMSAAKDSSCAKVTFATTEAVRCPDGFHDEQLRSGKSSLTSSLHVRTRSAADDGKLLTARGEVMDSVAVTDILVEFAEEKGQSETQAATSSTGSVSEAGSHGDVHPGLRSEGRASDRSMGSTGSSTDSTTTKERKSLLAKIKMATKSPKLPTGKTPPKENPVNKNDTEKSDSDQKQGWKIKLNRKKKKKTRKSVSPEDDTTDVKPKTDGWGRKAPTAESEDYSDPDPLTGHSKTASPFHDNTLQRAKKAAAMQAKQEALDRLHLAQEVQRELEELEVRQKELEARGVVVEQAMNGEGPDADRDETEVMQEWFQLVHDKNVVVRRESELMIRAKELELEERHERLQNELHTLAGKKEKKKSKKEKQAEGKMLAEMMEVVDQRDALVTLLEEERLREKEEDKQLIATMEKKGIPISSPPLCLSPPNETSTECDVTTAL